MSCTTVHVRSAGRTGQHFHVFSQMLVSRRSTAWIGSRGSGQGGHKAKGCGSQQQKHMPNTSPLSNMSPFSPCTYTTYIAGQVGPNTGWPIRRHLQKMRFFFLTPLLGKITSSFPNPYPLVIHTEHIMWNVSTTASCISREENLATFHFFSLTVEHIQ